MAGQEGSNNNKCESLIPKFQYKRPDTLREMFPNTDSLFKPRVVSLGPVYHKEKNCQVTEKDKCKIKEVLERKKVRDFDSDEMVKIALGKARDLYERKELNEMMKPDDSNEMKPEDFDKMMILDACFVIHAIDYINEGKSEVLDERPHLLPLILEDMFLLENQVPIEVLEAAMKVFGRKYPQDIDEFVKKIAQSPKGARTFSDMLMELPWPFQFLVFLLLIPITLAILLVLSVVVLPLSLILLVVCLPLGLVWVMCRVCCCAHPQGGNGNENQVDLEQQKKKGSNENKEREPSHNENQVDPKQQKKKDSNGNKEPELTSDPKQQEKGSNEKEQSNLLGRLRANLLSCSEENQHAAAPHDNMWLPPRRATELTDAGIKFHRSTTSSVNFVEGFIHGHLFLPSLAQLTKTRLVNLMVYEFCQGVGGHGITSYVSFLDGLIDCPEDVKELRSTQILPKALGDDQEVTHFFNKVGNFLAPFAYHNVLKDIDTHCKSGWKACTAKFWDKHFSSPWTTVSFLIAILLFAITIATAYKSFFG